MFNVKIIGGDQSSGTSGAGTSVLVAQTAQLYGIYAFNSAASTDYYLQVFDSATVPADGATPLMVFSLPHNQSLSQQFNDSYTFKNGIYVCASTTAKTKTLAVANDVFIQLSYRLMT
jgi:hypothetical protein